MDIFGRTKNILENFNCLHSALNLGSEKICGVSAQECDNKVENLRKTINFPTTKKLLEMFIFKKVLK